jgi:hypothetical protein
MWLSFSVLLKLRKYHTALVSMNCTKSNNLLVAKLIMVLGMVGPLVRSNQLLAQEPVALNSVQQKFTISVKDCGAKGDGLSDDTRAIQLAINAASPFGKIVCFPQGTYLVSEAKPGCGYALLITKPVCLQGEGVHTCILPSNTIPEHVHTLVIKPDPNFAADHTLIEGLFIGDPRTGQRAGNAGIFIDTLGNGSYLPMLTLRNCFVAQGKGPALWHANDRKVNVNGGVWCALIEHNSLMGGLRLDGSGDSIVIRGNRISGSGVGVDIDLVEGASLLSIAENNITSTGGAIRVRNARRFEITNNNCEQVVLGGPEGAMFDITGTRGAISCGRIANNHLGAFTNSGIKANIRVKNSEFLVIEQNTLLPASKRTWGIDLDGTKDIIIGRNTFGPGSPNQIQDRGVGSMGVTQALPLSPPWAVTGLAEPAPSCRKSPDGFVLLWGTAQFGGAQIQRDLTVLPQGFRPERTQRFKTAGSVVIIMPSGVISVQPIEGGQGRLDGISFLAAGGSANIAGY